MNIPKELKEKPCEEGIEYFKTQKNKKEAWNNCERGDWMWWAMLNSDVEIENIKNLCNEFIEDCKSRAYADADAYADANAYARAYANAYAYAYANAYESGKQAEWIKLHIPYPFGK
jgi:hypothetical protein